MKKINPLTLILVSVLLFLVSIVSLQKVNNQYYNEKDQMKNFFTKAQEYVVLKNHWYNKNEIKEKLQKHLKSSGISKFFIGENSSKISVEIDSFTLDSIDKLLNKILNDKFSIYAIELNKSNVKLEIGF
ncbi:MAG: hypothetical protein IE909_01210 [Campylobacterales bacterium]|nr:hypothetical protein [Campylobacterales bacterium]